MKIDLTAPNCKQKSCDWAECFSIKIKWKMIEMHISIKVISVRIHTPDHPGQLHLTYSLFSWPSTRLFLPICTIFVIGFLTVMTGDCNVMVFLSLSFSVF